MQWPQPPRLLRCSISTARTRTTVHGRPRITVSGDILTVDLSSQNRPPATGLIFDDHTILVIFPDVSAWFRGTLVAPGSILWSNNTIWQKLPYVPNVTGDSLKDAVAALKVAGFTAKPQRGPSCGSGPGVVIRQTPAAGAQAVLAPRSPS